MAIKRDDDQDAGPRLIVTNLADVKPMPRDGTQLRQSDLSRDLMEDLAICRAATAGGWMAMRESDEWGTLGTPVCRMDDDPAIVVGHPSDYGPGASPADDAHMIAQSRSGWPAAIRRALHAEAELAALKASPPLDQVTFDALVRWWHADTTFVSSATKITAHPAYRRVVAAGRGAVPFIIAELRKGPDHWSCALREITGEDPVDPADHGDMEAMRRAWLAWAERNGVG